MCYSNKTVKYLKSDELIVMTIKKYTQSSIQVNLKAVNMVCSYFIFYVATTNIVELIVTLNSLTCSSISRSHGSRYSR